jgi:hypothetical protein
MRAAQINSILAFNKMRAGRPTAVEPAVGTRLAASSAGFVVPGQAEIHKNQANFSRFIPLDS